MQNNEKKRDSGPLKINKAAIDRLVNADKKTYPKGNVDPGKQYRSKGFIDKIPSTIKALFIKFWFNGAVCFFIFWGLGEFIFGLDMLVVLGIVKLFRGISEALQKGFIWFCHTPDSN